MIRELGDVVKDQLVWIPQKIEVSLLGVRHDASHNLCVTVFELSVSSKLLSLLWIRILICHYLD